MSIGSDNLKANLASRGMLSSSGNMKAFDYAGYINNLRKLYPWKFGRGTAEAITGVRLDNIDSSSDYEEPERDPLSPSEEKANIYDYYGLNDNFISGREGLNAFGQITGTGMATGVIDTAIDYSAGMNISGEIGSFAGGMVGGMLGPNPLEATSVGEYQNKMMGNIAASVAGSGLGELGGQLSIGSNIGDWYNREYFSEDYSRLGLPGSQLAELEMARDYPELIRDSNEWKKGYDERVNQYTGAFSGKTKGFRANSQTMNEETQDFLNKSNLAEGLDWKGDSIDNFTSFDAWEAANPNIGMLTDRVYEGPLEEGELERMQEENKRNLWSQEYTNEFSKAKAFDKDKNPLERTPLILSKQQRMEAINGPDPYNKGYEAFGKEGDNTSRDAQGNVFHGPNYNWGSTDGGASDVSWGGTDTSEGTAAGDFKEAGFDKEDMDFINEGFPGDDNSSDSQGTTHDSTGNWN